MRYLIQIFKPSDPNYPDVGSWHNTNAGGDNRDTVLARAKEMTKVPRTKFSRVRVCEVLFESVTGVK